MHVSRLAHIAESPFGKAFKRSVGVTPGAFRQREGE
ncbi:hypothetical protein MXAN_2149 [Myxococcus xanthus DK 1622]|uniref:HTH araC/xylS-type domain-containing protein n=1 Tax=Myxococcus xanthus (strain DK1622) TaxID=246197 RepID=Q1DAF1_MYXXD|nr:hypothetical protein MXAN_2149 [Myxococcus xanthus DK 1622]